MFLIHHIIESCELKKLLNFKRTEVNLSNHRVVACLLYQSIDLSCEQPRPKGQGFSCHRQDLQD